jgi:uncharacterized protein YjdB
VTSLRLSAARRLAVGRSLRLVRHLAGLAAGLGLGSAPVATIAAQTVSEVQVTPETMTMPVGQKQTIFATAYDRQGNIIASAKFTFWSSDTAIARVSKEGTVQGMAPGLAKVEARTGNRRASLAVLITGASSAAGAGALLTLDPTAAMLLPGELAQVTPQAVHEDGSASDIGPVAWKSLKPEVATVDSTGLVLGVAPGKSIVQASTSTGLMATLPVEVEQAELALSGATGILGPQESETLTVVVPSQNNRAVTRGIQWASADSGIASVTPDGIVTARAPGRTEIVMTGLGQERRAPLVVHRLPQTLVLTPRPVAEPIELPLRAARQFAAVAQAGDSTPIPEARVAWEVGDSSRVAFDRATGTLTARDTGETTLTARLRGFDPVIWHIRVVPGVLALDRNRLGLKPGERATLSASVRDDANRVVAQPGAVWTSDRPDVAAVTAGEVRAVGPGHAVVTAAAPWGKSVSADVFVTADLMVTSDRGGAMGLYQIRLDSPDALLPLGVDGGARQGVVSPDRTRIVYRSDKGGSPDLYLADADGQNARPLTHDPSVESDQVWTPDGTRLIFTTTPPGGVAQVASLKMDGTDPRTLTSSAGGNRSADVSPDGRRVVFVSLRDGNPELYETDLGGGPAQRLTKTGDKEGSPRFLPNGDLIYLVDKGSKTRVMRLAGAGSAAPLPVLEIDQPVVGFDLSRDGERIAYVAGKLAEPGKKSPPLSLRIQPLAPRTTPVVVPLRPGEQVLSPSF